MALLLDLSLGGSPKSTTIHLPIALLFAASVFDLLAYAALTSPTSFHPLVKLYNGDLYSSHSTITLIQTLSLFSYALNIGGIITAIPVFVSGLLKSYSTVASKGFDLSNPDVRAALIHNTPGDVAIAGALYNWVTQRGNEDFVPSTENMFISSVILGAILYSGAFGESLVYRHTPGGEKEARARTGQGPLDDDEVHDLDDKVEKVHNTLDKFLKGTEQR